MSYKSLLEACVDLERKGQLIRIADELDGNLVIPELHRRVQAIQGPALFFENIRSSNFPGVSNLFGTNDRCEFLFRDVLNKLDWLIKLKADPEQILKKPFSLLKHLPFLLKGIPRKTFNQKLTESCTVSELPKIRAWPMDGGSFVTLPQVISFPPGSLEPKKANVGMYRIQLDGNDYKVDQEIGLHYQLHRGIGNHHQLYKNSELPFNISIGIGGPPANTLASIFPLPEGLSEILFNGFLNNRRYRYHLQNNQFIPQDVDFCITGTVAMNELKNEGPFGDHLGYYSLQHPFPFLNNIKVYHKPNPIYHFTVVGRPPQEDSGFGFLIHKMVSELTAVEYPGIKQLHAVDAAGVHPLLLAVGSERYMPFRDRKPEELLTSANLLLGKGQTSLSKYLFIAAEEEERAIDVHQVKDFFEYIFERVDFNQDLHFYTNTTIDTLDYSGNQWNGGSKLVVACNRNKSRKLSSELQAFNDIPDPFKNCKLIQKGIVLIEAPPFLNYEAATQELKLLTEYLNQHKFQGFPLVVLCDDSNFSSANYSNFLWVAFTRSNPSHDIYGVCAGFRNKHWFCKDTLIIDSRKKPHHAPDLVVDPQTSRTVDHIISKNKTLKKLFT